MIRIENDGYSIRMAREWLQSGGIAEWLDETGERGAVGPVNDENGNPMNGPFDLRPPARVVTDPADVFVAIRTREEVRRIPARLGNVEADTLRVKAAINREMAEFYDPISFSVDEDLNEVLICVVREQLIPILEWKKSCHQTP